MAPRARKGSGTGEQAAGIQERSRNVPWNQLFSKLRTYRGLGKGERHDRGFGRVGGEAPPERLYSRSPHVILSFRSVARNLALKK